LREKEKEREREREREREGDVLMELAQNFAFVHLFVCAHKMYTRVRVCMCVYVCVYVPMCGCVNR